MCVCARACTRLPLPAAERPVGSRDGGHAALALGTRPHLPRRTLGHPTCALDRIAARVFSSGNPATLWSCDTASAHARRARTRRVARNEGSPHGEEGDERRVGRRRRPANIRAAHRLVAAVVVGRVQLSTTSEPCSMRIPSRSLDAPRVRRGFAVLISRSVWQAEEAVANLPLRLAVRVHCGHQVLRGPVGY